MTKEWRRCGCITLLMLLLHVAWLQPLQAATNDTKPVWQQTDATATSTYLTNRRALVGSGCMVNRLGNDGITVVPTITNLENLCDEDLTNVTTVSAVVDATVAVGPLVSVKDVKNYYAAGTQAGFIVTGDASSVISLSAADYFSIMFYCDGKLVGTEAVTEKQSTYGAGISIMQTSDDAANKEYVATAPAKFDEIRLAQTAVLSASVGEEIGIKYAFVGSAKEYTITQSSMKEYNSDLTVKSNSTNVGTIVANWRNGYLDDDDLENKTTIKVGLNTKANVRAYSSDDSEAFPEGTTVGFKYRTAKILEATVGDVATITLYDHNDEQVYEQTVSAALLTLNLVSAKDNAVSITSTKAFSRVRFALTGVGLDLGTASAYYAFVQLPPDVEKHHCDINASADLNVCDCDDEYQLTASQNVTWTVAEKPSGSSVSVDENGLVSGLNVVGKYVFTATATDSCTENVTINYGTSSDLVNKEANIERLTGSDYEASNGSSADISLFSSLTNADAITSTSLRDYAYYTGGADLAGKEHIVSVKKSSTATPSTWSYTTDKYVGFIVLANTSAINANLLDFLTVDLYKDGTKVSGSLVKNNAVLSADLINTAGSAAQRTVYSVKVPAGTEFDEIALNKKGTLSVDLAKLNVYYAYISDNDGSPETTGTLISYSTTGASIDAANTEFVAAANAVNTTFGLTDLVDDDLTTGVTLPAVSVANGTKIGVKLGRTINHEKQNLLIVTSTTNVVLAANIAQVLKVELYKNGAKVADNATGSGVDVLNANVLGYSNTYSYINVSSTTTDFDEVVMTYGNGATVANAFKIYGLILRNDYNGDGVPDMSDPEPCAQELVLDEDVSLDKSKSYTKARMIFHRTFNGDAWNSVILPVDLTKAQFAEAFGSDAKLSEVSCLKTEETTKDNTTTTTNTLVFKTVSEETDGVFMAKNTPYIIYISSTTLAAHPTETSYESIDDGEVTGSLYFVDNGISFDKSNTYETTHSAEAEASAFTLTGSYKYKQELEAGSYVFSKGDLYYTTSAHTQKAYRCWISYNGTDANAQLKGFSVDDDATTSIHRVINDTTGNGALYNLMGQRVSAPTAPGLYIINGKKVIVK